MSTQGVGADDRPGPPPADDAITAGGTGARVEELTRRSLYWLVLTAVVSRVLFTVPAVILNRSVLGEAGDRVLPIAAVVIGIDLVLLVVALRRPALLTARWLFAADIAVTAVATVAATLLIPPGTFLLPGPDALTGYGWGTVVLWTGVRGWRTGAVLAGATPVVQVAMAALNGADFDAGGVANLAFRTAIALLTLGGAGAVVVLARRGARWVVAEGLRAGRLAERAENLRSLHDTALAELDAVVLLTSRSARPAAERLALVTERADQQVARLFGAASVSAGGLHSRLAAVADDFGTRGLSITVIGDAPPGSATWAPDVVDALEGSVREALNNVTKHAAVREAVVRVQASADVVEVDVIDTGRGFRPGPDHTGYGLARSIPSRMREVGGRVLVTSAPGRGTQVRLSVPRRRPPGGTVRGSRAGIRWIPIVPLAWRMLSLPLIAFMIGPYLVDHVLHLGLLLLVLFAGHLALLSALLRPGADRILRSTPALVIDTAVAAAFYLWTAATEQAGSVLLPNSDGAWLYVIATVALWMAARGAAVGVPVLTGAVTLQFAAAALNDTTLTSATGSHVVLHVVQVVAAAGCAYLVRRMARRGADLALAEGMRAGRQAERVEVFADLHRRVLRTWEAIACPTDEEPGARLDAIRAAAAGMAGELRSALRDDRRDDDRNGLAAALDFIAQDVRRRGLQVELVVTELAGDPPPDVVAAMVRATEAGLRHRVETLPEGTVVVRLTGSPVEVEVSIRDETNATGGCAEMIPTMAAVGGRVEVRPMVDRGSRTTLRWTAP